MEIAYERNLSGAHMILPRQEPVEIGYQRRMILENQIRGFVSLQSRDQEYDYDISSLVSLKEYLDHSSLQCGCLKQLIFSLYQAVTELGRYLLTEEFLYLTPETIFVQTHEAVPFQGTFLFCLYPDFRQDVRGRLSQLLKFLMDKTDPGDDSCAVLCYELYGLVQKENFYLKEFMEALERHAEPLTGPESEKKKRAKQLFAGRRNSGIIDTDRGVGRRLLGLGKFGR